METASAAARDNGVMATVTSSLTIDDVRAAAARLAGEIGDTPCLASRTLSQICGCEVFLKFENLQFTASFKERGALNKMAQLRPPSAPRACSRSRPATTRRRSPTTRSAWASRRRSSCRASPRRVKVENTRGFGAEVVLDGDTFDDARVARPEARRGARLHRGPSVRRPGGDRRPGHGRARDAGAAAGDRHPGRRHRRRRPDRRHGDGGARRCVPTCTSSACRPSASRRRGTRSTTAHRESRQATIADGIGVKSPGALTLPVIRALVDDVVLVSRRRHRAGDPDAARDREDGGRRRRRGRPGGADEGPRALRRQEGRAWSSAAATSSRWCWPRSSSAAWSSRAASCACASTCATSPARSPTSRRCSAASAPTSTRSSTSARSPRSRSSASQIEVVVQTRGAAHVAGDPRGDARARATTPSASAERRLRRRRGEPGASRARASGRRRS